MLELNKFSLVITTRCNLRCRLCCEYVPQNKPFPDMTVEEARRILAALFDVVHHVNTLHLTGGGEPFLHPRLPELIDAAMEYAGRFDTLMLFSNSTVPVSDQLMETVLRHKDRILVQLSRYGRSPQQEEETLRRFQSGGVRCKAVNYYGAEQSFGGWVDFGPWEAQEASAGELEERFHACAVTRDMHGNWRTRDGKVHWCSRSQRGMELGLIPDDPADYVDLFDGTSREEKQEQFKAIAAGRYLSACGRCSGDQGTDDPARRHPAAEQL